jgi:glycerol uptake facilitator-like aquaporin
MYGRARRLAAEGAGTAFLLVAIIGSGIMGERLAAGNMAIALLANSIATGCGLAVLILVFAPVSGAHFNPAVTLVAAINGGISRTDAIAYAVVQVCAAFIGVGLVDFMFGEPVFAASQKARTGPPQWTSEAVATFGLIVTIASCSRHAPKATPFAVALYITGAYWFTSSTSFANPAVTLARAASNTFAGIRPDDMAAFIVAQLAGALAGMAFMRWLLRSDESRPA